MLTSTCARMQEGGRKPPPTHFLPKVHPHDCARAHTHTPRDTHTQTQTYPTSHPRYTRMTARAHTHISRNTTRDTHTPKHTHKRTHFTKHNTQHTPHDTHTTHDTQRVHITWRAHVVEFLALLVIRLCVKRVLHGPPCVGLHDALAFLCARTPALVLCGMNKKRCRTCWSTCSAAWSIQHSGQHLAPCCCLDLSAQRVPQEKTADCKLCLCLKLCSCLKLGMCLKLCTCLNTTLTRPCARGRQSVSACDVHLSSHVSKQACQGKYALHLLDIEVHRREACAHEGLEKVLLGRGSLDGSLGPAACADMGKEGRWAWGWVKRAAGAQPVEYRSDRLPSCTTIIGTCVLLDHTGGVGLSSPPLEEWGSPHLSSPHLVRQGEPLSSPHLER